MRPMCELGHLPGHAHTRTYTPVSAHFVTPFRAPAFVWSLTHNPLKYKHIEKCIEESHCLGLGGTCVCGRYNKHLSVSPHLLQQLR